MTVTSFLYVFHIIDGTITSLLVQWACPAKSAWEGSNFDGRPLAFSAVTLWLEVIYVLCTIGSHWTIMSDPLMSLPAMWNEGRVHPVEESVLLYNSRSAPLILQYQTKVSG